jgi:hypothetical protein
MHPEMGGETDAGPRTNEPTIGSFRERSRAMSSKWIAILAAIWLTAIGSAVLLIAVIDRQRTSSRPASAESSAEALPKQEADEPAVDSEGAPVLEMPVVEIVAPPVGGVAEMQGTDEVIIGPGTVTHPAAKPPSRAATPRP